MPNSSSMPGGARSINSAAPVRAGRPARRLRRSRHAISSSAASSSARCAASARGASSSRTRRFGGTAPDDGCGSSPTGASSTSPSECAGSVDSSRIRRAGAARASRSAAAAAAVVLPTPPFPPKNSSERAADRRQRFGRLDGLSSDGWWRAPRRPSAVAAAPSRLEPSGHDVARAQRVRRTPRGSVTSAGIRRRRRRRPSRRRIDGERLSFLRPAPIAERARARRPAARD